MEGLGGRDKEWRRCGVVNKRRGGAERRRGEKEGNKG